MKENLVNPSAGKSPALMCLERKGKTMTIRHIYTFTNAQEAHVFAHKYSKIWFITSPIRDGNEWYIIRYITILEK